MFYPQAQPPQQNKSAYPHRYALSILVNELAEGEFVMCPRAPSGAGEFVSCPRGPRGGQSSRCDSISFTILCAALLKFFSIFFAADA